MCDTFVALGNATADGGVIFGKNSDREANEAQALVYQPAAMHPTDATVKCTFIEIPQARETLAVMLSKPFWMFGCEMGANEAGVVMGNEAVFTKELYATTGLTGMDLMRLALERADTAGKALRTILDLLGRYGQCALGGYRHTFKYHNAFLIADLREAYVLETAGQYWVVEQVRSTRAISNGLSIGRQWDDSAPGLVENALRRGWSRSRTDFDFAQSYREPLYTYFSASRRRQACVAAALQTAQGQITPQWAATILRDHGPAGETPGWTPERGLFMQVCAHAAWGPIRGGGGQTTGSMIAHLGERSTYWFTGTAAPCTSLFKPAWFEAGAALMKAFGPSPGPRYDPATRWWRHERLHRATLEDYVNFSALYRQERDALEARWFADAGQVGDVAGYVTECFEGADAAEDAWLARVMAAPARRRPGFLYRAYWAGQNREAGM